MVKVAGPAATLLASAHRLGWIVSQGRHIVTDDHVKLDMLLDPPQVITAAGHKAVRRWRLWRIAAIFPSLVPECPDIERAAMKPGQVQTPVRTYLVDFVDVLGGLLQHGAAKCSVFDLWEARFRGSLRSAMTGGQ